MVIPSSECGPAYGHRVDLAEVVVIGSIFPQGLLGALVLLDLFYASG